MKLGLIAFRRNDIRNNLSVAYPGEFGEIDAVESIEAFRTDFFRARTRDDFTLKNDDDCLLYTSDAADD